MNGGHSAYSPCKSGSQKGLGGCGYKGVSALSLPFNLSVFSNSAPSHSVDNEPTDLATVRNILHEKLQTTNYKLQTAKGIKWNPGMSISVNMIRTSDSCQLSFWDFCFSDEVVTAFAVAVVLQFNRGALNLWQHWWAGNCNARLQAWTQLHGRQKAWTQLQMLGLELMCTLSCRETESMGKAKHRQEILITAGPTFGSQDSKSY